MGIPGGKIFPWELGMRLAFLTCLIFDNLIGEDSTNSKSGGMETPYNFFFLVCSRFFLHEECNNMTQKERKKKKKIKKSADAP